MKDFQLTQEEQSLLKKAHKSEHYKRSAYKINAVILLGTGWTLEKVKTALLLDDETLRGYVKKFRDGGLQELLKVEYKGSEPYLSVAQVKQLCDALDNKIFLTTQAVFEY